LVSKIFTIIYLKVHWRYHNQSQFQNQDHLPS
jgi:hypothetical protein